MARPEHDSSGGGPRSPRDGEARLREAIEAVGGDPAQATSMYADLRARYKEPHRAYHTMEHIESCLSWLDWTRGMAERAGELELAIWFHDAVYDPTRGDNEERSAVLASERLASADVPAVAIERIGELIRSTERHDAAVGDGALLQSIDLAILGARQREYDRFEAAVRAEYAHVPEPVYRQGRSAVLGRFLAAPRIYANRTMGEMLEARARENLERSLRALAPTHNDD